MTIDDISGNETLPEFNQLLYNLNSCVEVIIRNDKKNYC